MTEEMKTDAPEMGIMGKYYASKIAELQEVRFIKTLILFLFCRRAKSNANDALTLY